MQSIDISRDLLCSVIAKGKTLQFLLGNQSLMLCGIKNLALKISRACKKSCNVRNNTATVTKKYSFEVYLYAV
jgi:hypothetical protein